MSRKGDCWDNACAESFFHSLKVELIMGEPLKNRTQTREAIFEYIEVNYNRYRRHSAIGFVSPDCFEESMTCPVLLVGIMVTVGRILNLRQCHGL